MEGPPCRRTNVAANSRATAGHRMPKERRLELEAILRRLTAEQSQAMVREIRKWTDECGDKDTDFFASNWKTGFDWNEFAGGVFEPLYEVCDDGSHANSVEYAGWMFGWLVRLVLAEETEEEWVYYKNPEAGTGECPRNMWGTFYFRQNRTAAIHKR